MDGGQPAAVLWSSELRQLLSLNTLTGFALINVRVGSSRPLPDLLPFCPDATILDPCSQSQGVCQPVVGHTLQELLLAGPDQVGAEA